MSNTVSRHRQGAAIWPTTAASLYAADNGRKYVNAAERQRVLAAMEGLAADKALFGLTLAWTGARVSEVLALTAASFQVESAVVAIITLKRRRFVVREVPIPPWLMLALDGHFSIRERQRASDADARLWPWCRVTAWRLIKQVMAVAEIAGRQACPRGLRHGFGVGILQAQVPINLLQIWLGHSKLSTTAMYAAACGPEERAFAGRFWAAATSIPNLRVSESVDA